MGAAIAVAGMAYQPARHAHRNGALGAQRGVTAGFTSPWPGQVWFAQARTGTAIVTAENRGHDQPPAGNYAVGAALAGAGGAVDAADHPGANRVARSGDGAALGRAVAAGRRDHRPCAR